MKKKIVLITIILLITTFSIFGQTRQITEKEFDEAGKIADENVEKLKYRETTTIEEFESGKLTSAEFITDEYIPPDKSRFLSVENKGNKINTVESITIGYKVYRRENNGRWVQETDEKGNSLTGMPPITITGNEADNHKDYTVEETIFNNQKVRIFSVTTFYAFQPFISHNYRRWINSENLILKTEEVETDIGSATINRRSISINEYNPQNLKIEAPIIPVKHRRRKLR